MEWPTYDLSGGRACRLRGRTAFITLRYSPFLWISCSPSIHNYSCVMHFKSCSPALRKSSLIATPGVSQRRDIWASRQDRTLLWISSHWEELRVTATFRATVVPERVENKTWRAYIEMNRVYSSGWMFYVLSSMCLFVLYSCKRWS